MEFGDEATHMLEQANEAKRSSGDNEFSTEIAAAQYLYEMRLYDLCEYFLKEELQYRGKSFGYLFLLTKLHLQTGKYAEAQALLNDLMPQNSENVDLWIIQAELALINGDNTQALKCFQKANTIQKEGTMKRYVELWLGKLYIMGNDLISAKNLFLTLCKKAPTSYTWLCAGIAAYRMGDFEEAQAAFAVPFYAFLFLVS
jgi:tetratricopeptide (TPR) repeat protein